MKRLERFLPENIVLSSNGTLCQHSDYYGALLKLEGALKNEKTHSLVIEVLIDNFFVPNYKTKKKKLNDWVRSMLQKEEVLPGSRTLDKLIEKFSEEKIWVDRCHKEGYSTSEKDSFKRRLDQKMSDAREYGSLLQRLLFRLRPQKTSFTDVSSYLAVHNNLVSAIGKGFSKAKANFEETMGELSFEGEEIEEASFFYRGEKHFSTKEFVKEWKRVGDSLDNLENLSKGKKSFKLPSISLPGKYHLRKIFEVGLVGVALFGALYVLPGVRYKLGLPLTSKEKVEALYEDGKYQESISALSFKKMSKGYFHHWHAKNELKMFRDYLNNSTNPKESFSNAKITLNLTGVHLAISGDLEEDKRFLFSIGYIKFNGFVKNYNGNNSSGAAARTHLSHLFSESEREPEEQELYDLVKDRDVFHVGTFDDKVLFLARKGNDDCHKITYKMEQKGGKYLVRTIVFKDVSR